MDPPLSPSEMDSELLDDNENEELNPNKKFLLKYTTVSGVEGFDGTHKKAEKAVVKTIS